MSDSDLSIYEALLVMLGVFVFPASSFGILIALYGAWMAIIYTLNYFSFQAWVIVILHELKSQLKEREK